MKEFTFTMELPQHLRDYCHDHPEDFTKIAEQCAYVAEYVIHGWISRKKTGAEYKEEKQLELKKEAEKLRQRATALEKEAGEL